MPLSNGRELRLNTPAPSRNTQNGRMVSSSGYDLGPSNVRSNNMMDAYNNLRRYRQQRPPQQQQQEQAYQEPAPDTNGWEQANTFERGLHGLAEKGEQLSDLFGYGEAWQRTKDNWRDGDFNFKEDVGGLFESAGKFGLGLIPMSVGGLMMDPQYAYEAATGKDMQNMYNGLIDNDRLGADQRLASAGYVALDALSFIPGIGTAGRAARTGLTVGKGALGRGITRENFEQIADQELKRAAKANEHFDRNAARRTGLDLNDRENWSAEDLEKFQQRRDKSYNAWQQRHSWSPSERASNFLVKKITGKDHPYISGFAGASVEEASQEFLQTMMEDIRGDQESHGVENINLLGDLEAAAFGAVGGSMFHGVNIGMNKARDVHDREKTEKLKAQANAGDLSAQSKLMQMAFSGNQHARKAMEDVDINDWDSTSNQTELQSFDRSGLKNEVNPEIAEKLETRMSNRNREAVGASGTMVVDHGLHGAKVTIDSMSVLGALQDKDSRKAKSDGTSQADVMLSKLTVSDYEISKAQGTVEDNGDQRIKDRNARAKASYQNVAADYDRLAEIKQQVSQIVQENKADAPGQLSLLLREALAIRKKLGLKTRLLWTKQPATNDSPFYLDIEDITDEPGAGVSQVVASATNADYDGDLGQWFLDSYDHEKSGKAIKHLYQVLTHEIDSKYTSAVDWVDASLDIAELDDATINDIAHAIAISNPAFASLKKGVINLGNINGKFRQTESHGVKGVEDLIRDTLTEIRKHQKEDKKRPGHFKLDDDGNYAFSKLIKELFSFNESHTSTQFDIENIFEEIRTAVLLKDTIMANSPNRQQQTQMVKDKVDETKSSNVHIAPESIQAGYMKENYSHPAILAMFGLKLPAPTEEAMAKGETNAIFRMLPAAVWRVLHYSVAERGTWNTGEEMNIPNGFDILLNSELDLYDKGLHDNAKIISLYNELATFVILRHLPLDASGGKITISKDFKIEDVFTDDVIDELNALSKRFNEAIENYYYRKGTAPDPNGPIPRKMISKENVTADSIAEFLYPIVSDSQSVHQLFSSYISDEAAVEIFDDLGINLDSTPKVFFLQQDEFGNNWPAELWEYFKDDSGEINEDAVAIFKGLAHAAENRNSYGEHQLIDHLEKPLGETEERILTKDELREAFPEMSEEQLDYYYEDTGFHVFIRLCRELGFECTESLGWIYYGNFLEEKFAKAYMDSKTPGERKAIAFAMLLHGITHQVRSYCEDLTGGLTHITDSDPNLAILWAQQGCSNGNPIHRMVGNQILQFAQQAEVIEDPVERERSFAESVIKYLDEIETWTKGFDGITQQLAESEPDISVFRDRKPVNQRLWFTWARTGLTGYPQDINQVYKLDQADAAVNSITAYEMIRGKKDLDNAINHARLLGHDAATILNNLRTLAMRPVRIDDSVKFERIYSILIAWSQALEKAQSIPGLANFVGALRSVTGEMYQTYMGLQSGAITGSEAIAQFTKQRNKILGIVFDLKDSNGKPYEIHVTDAKNESSSWVSHKTLFPEEAKSTEQQLSQIIEFFKMNPQLISWLYPAKATIVNIGSESYVTVLRDDNASDFLADEYDKVYTERLAPGDYSEDSKPWESATNKRYREEALQWLYRSPMYDALVVAAMNLSDLDIMNPAEVQAAIKTAMDAIDNRYLHFLQSQHIAPDSAANEDLDRELGSAKMQSLLYLFNTTELTDLAERSSHNVVYGIATQAYTATQAAISARIVADIINENRDENSKLKFKSSYSGVETAELTDVMREFSIINELLQIYRRAGTVQDDLRAFVNQGDQQMVFDCFEGLTQADKDAITATMKNIVIEDYTGNTLSFIPPTPSFGYAETYVSANFNKAGKTTYDFADSNVTGYIASIRRFVKGTKGLEIPESAFTDLHNAIMSESGKTDGQQRAQEHINSFWLEYAYSYMTTVAANRGICFTAENNDLINDYARTAFNFAADGFHEDRLNEDDWAVNKAYINLVDPNDKKPVHWHFFDPANMNAMALAVDMQVSAESSMGIGMNGIIPAYISAFSALRDYICGSGNTVSLDDYLKGNPGNRRPDYVKFNGFNIEGYPPYKQQTLVRRIVEEWNSQTGSEYVDDETILFKPTIENATKLYDILANLNIMPQEVADITVIKQSEQCSSGICKIHNPGLIDFLLKLCAKGQEDRLMKIKKNVLIAKDAITGVIRPGTEIKTNICVRTKDDVGGQFDLDTVLNHGEFVAKEYAKSIKLNNDGTGDDIFASIDSDEDWERWAEPYAQTLTCCVTITFDNGDTATLSRHQLIEAKRGNLSILDPFHGQIPGDAYHQGELDWSKVESIDWTPVDLDEFAFHINDHIREVDDDPNNTRQDWGNIAADAYNDWSKRNRRYQAADDDAHSLNPQMVFAHTGMLRKSIPYLPKMNVLPSHRTRFLTNTNFHTMPRYGKNPNVLKPKDMIDNFSAIVAQGSNGRTPVVAIETSIKDINNLSSKDLQYKDILQSADSIRAAADDVSTNSDYYISNGAVVAITSNIPTEATDNFIKRVVTKAVKSGCPLVIQKDQREKVANILGVNNVAGETVTLAMVPGEEFIMINPRSLARAAYTARPRVKVPTYKSEREPYLIIGEITGFPSPQGDSAMLVTQEMAKHWQTTIHEKEHEAPIPFTNYSWHMIDENYSDELTRLKDALNTIKGITDKEQRVRELAKVLDLSAIAPKKFDTPEQGAERVSTDPEIIMESVLNWIADVENDPSNFHVASDVRQGVVIAMTYCPRLGKFAPVLYTGAVARNKAVISIEHDYNNHSKFKYYWSCDLNMADDLDRIKAYLVDIFGFKSMLVMDKSGLSIELGIKRGEKKIMLPLAAILDTKAVHSRIPEAAQDWVRKLTLFVVLRQMTHFDVMSTRVPTSRLGGPGIARLGENMKQDQNSFLHKMFEYKGDLARRPQYAEIWELFAKGEIFVSRDPRGRTTTQQQRRSLQKLVRACLNCGMNPSLLFSSVVHTSDGKVGETDDMYRCDFWNVMLSDTPNNITIDDVVSYCNFVDDTFCPPTCDDMTNKEFIESGYFTDHTLRCVYDVGAPTGSKFPTGEVLGRLYASKYATGGSISVGAVSSQVTMNERLIWLDQGRNGFKPGFPVRKSYAGVLKQFDRYSDQDLLSMHESAPDYFKQLSLAERHDNPYGSVMGGFGKIPSNAYGEMKSEAIQLIRDKRGYYKHPEEHVRVYDRVKQGKVLEAKDLYKIWETEIHTMEGCTELSFETWLRLIECNTGWTPSADKNAMSWDRFNAANRFIKQSLRNKTIPIISGRHTIPNYRNKVVVIGHIDRYWAKRLIAELNAGHYELSYGFDGIEALVKQNIAECKYGGKKNPLSSISDKATYKVLHDDVFYADAEWNSIDSKMMFEYKYNMRDELEAVKELARKFFGATEYYGQLEELLDTAEERLQNVQDAEMRVAQIELAPEGGNKIHAAMKRNEFNDSVWGFFNTLVEIRQIMAMTSPIIPFANFMDTFKGTTSNYLLNWLGEKGIPSPYKASQKNRMKLGNIDGKYDPQAEADTKKLITHNERNLDYIEALMMAKAGGPKEEIRFRNAMRSGMNPRDYINARRSIKYSKDAYEDGKRHARGMFEALYTCVMRIGGCGKIFRRRLLRNWLDNFLRIAGDDGLWFLEDNLADKIRSNPEQAFEMMWNDPVYSAAADKAWNQALTGNMGQASTISHFAERVLDAHPFFNFLVRSPLGFLFVRANININRRFLKKIIPGVSATEYILTDILEHIDISEHSVFARILHWATKTDPEDFMNEFKAHAAEYKMYNSLREAILIDLCHMSMPILGLVIAMSGALEPPDDDDLYDCYWEWSFLGAPIGEQWWLNDLIGPIIPWACWWKSYIDGRPSGMIMLNAVDDFMNMSPFIAVGDLVEIFSDPESVLDDYKDNAGYFEDTQEGEPDLLTMFSAKSKAALLSWGASFVTPKIINDIYRYNNEYEVSYNRAYVYDEAGNPVYNEDGTLKTEKVSYAEAQLRKVTRNNWMLGCFLDLLDSASGNDYVGYLADEMPRQVIYDSAQLQFEHTFSVWDYENDTYKSDEEIEATCTALLMILEQSDDMDALWHEGFYLDGRTKDALSSYIWGLYQDEIDNFNDLIQNGELDYLYLGNGDWDEGHAIASQMYEAHYDALNYYKSLYYDKLASEDLNQGLVTYNRYNTTYEKDANGDWYATGFRETTNPLFGIMPNQAGLFNENSELTAGNEGSWATRSVVTGEGMYDQEGNPYRALDPVIKDDYKWYSFDELAALMGYGGSESGNSTSNDDSAELADRNSPRGWGYSYVRGGGGGGGSRGGYVRIANRNYASTSKAQPAYAYNYNRRLNPHNTNFSRPNFANTMTGGKIYDAQLDYLRPNFETKGSREAYRRQDF